MKKIDSQEEITSHRNNFFEKLRIDLLKKVDCLWQTNNAKAYQKWHNYQKVAQCVSTHEKQLKAHSDMGLDGQC